MVTTGSWVWIGLAWLPYLGCISAISRLHLRRIAQGSSERQIAVTVDRADCTRALRAAHASLALSNSQLSIAVVGASGAVGTEFLRMLASTGLLVAGQRRPPKRRSGGAVQTSPRDLRVDLKVNTGTTEKLKELRPARRPQGEYRYY